MNTKLIFLTISIAIISISCAGNSATLSKESEILLRFEESDKAEKIWIKTNQESFSQSGDAYAKDLRKIKSLSQSRNFEDLVKMIDTVEKKWASDIKAKSYLFAEISNSLASYDFNNAKQYAYSVDLAKRVLEHSDTISIDLEYKMVSRLKSRTEYFYGVKDSKNWEKDRGERIRHLLHFYRRVNNNIDFAFDPNDKNNYPVGKVLVPNGKYRSGVSPEVIKEPEIRKKYIEAIQANKTKLKKLNDQLILRKLHKELPSMIKSFLISFYSVSPKNLPKLKEKFQLFNLDLNVRQDILRAVNETTEQKGKK